MDAMYKQIFPVNILVSYKQVYQHKTEEIDIINYIYSKFHNDLACIRAVMDQNVKQCTDFAVYFYQIRWFDITAFASKAPKLQEVVEITASGPTSIRLQIL